MGRRPIGDKAMTSSERQRRMRQRYRSENQALRDALSPASKRRTKVEMPPGEAADLTTELMNAVLDFHTQFRTEFEPKYRTWCSLKPPPPKAVRAKAEAYLELIANSFLGCCPSVQDRLAAKNALIADLKAERDARIAYLKSGEADGLEWLAERAKSWSPEHCRDAADQLMEGMDPGTIIRWLAGLIKVIPKGWALADFVQALGPADRKRLAAELAKRPAHR
jgi:hypothetical protein